MKSAALAATLVLCSMPAAHCFADELPPPPAHGNEYNDPRLARGFTALARPMVSAEIGVGWLTLPGASVCAERSSGQGCKNGDTSFELDVWQIYRSSRRFAFGAGLMLGLIPTTDAPRNDPEDIVRDHSRSYLTLEGSIRHYPYVGEGVELWWGLSGGLAVVSDRFVVSDKNSDLTLVGQRGSTIRTEGVAVGLLGGAAFYLADHWSLGTTLRYANWFLPTIAAQDPFLDEASLTGRNTVFSLGISLGYRIPL